MAALPDLRPVEGKYEILRKLGEGGMGIVYLVRHRLLHELRVVKVLRGQLRGQDELRERFLREARTAIHLRHPNVAQLYEFELDDDGTAYMVLEFIDGRTVEELVRSGGAGPLRLRLEVAVQALRALAFLHKKGFVHRDISPDNLMLTTGPDGDPLVKLLDLGIVKPLHGEGGMTGTQVFLGKVRYASPEQLESSQVDARSDLYSFGVLLYELLTGMHPIGGDDTRSLMSGHLFREPIPFERSDPAGEIPEELRRIVLDCLRKDPAVRVGTAVELRRRIQETDAFRAPLGAWVPPASTAAEHGAEARRSTSATSAQRHLDENFEIKRRTPAAPTPAAVAAEAPAAEDPGPGPEERARIAAELRRRVGELLAEEKLDEARWLVMGEAYGVLPVSEAEELVRQIQWRDAARRQLRFEVAISCAESSLAEHDLETAGRSLAEARALLPHDPRLRDLERRIRDAGG
jgi:serine/threonine protein kinase